MVCVCEKVTERERGEIEERYTKGNEEERLYKKAAKNPTYINNQERD